MKIYPSAGLILITVFTFLFPITSHALSTSQASLNFMCACGTCDEPLSTCECPQSDDYRAMISAMVGKGYSEEQIIQDFVGRWGPSVLVVNAAAAPRSIASRVDSRTMGFVLILFGVTFGGFLFGKHFRRSSAQVKARPARRNRVKSSPSGPGPSSKGKAEERIRFRDGVDDHLLDDYIEG